MRSEYSTIPADKRVQYLCGTDWFDDDDGACVFVRFYTLPVFDGDLVLPVGPTTDLFFLGRPFRLIRARWESFPYNTAIGRFVSDADGNPRLHIEDLRHTLPTSDYILISTPMDSPGAESFERSASRVDEFTGTIRLVTGNNFLAQIACEAKLDVASGEMVWTPTSVSVPMPCEGPFATDTDWSEVQQIRERIDALSDPHRSRCLLALRLFERAARTEPPAAFFLNWVALEVACDSHRTARILRALARAYGTDNAYIQNDLGWDQFRRIRTDLFHEGLEHDFPQDVERYTQRLFLDVLRSILGLECKRHLERYVEDGFGLERLRRDSGRHEYMTVRADDAPQGVS